MASTIGAKGLLDMSGEIDNTDLKNIVEAAADPVSASISGTAPATDVSPLDGASGTLTSTQAAQIGSFTMSSNCVFPSGAAKYGSDGLVTLSSGNIGRVSSYTLTLSAQEFDDTAMATPPPTWATFIPGQISGTFSIETNIDDTGKLPTPGTKIENSGEGGTFRISTATTVDNTIAADLIVTDVSPNIARGQKNTATVSGVLTGTITSAGDEALFGSGDVALPEDTDFTLHPDDGGSTNYSGTVFWTSVAITCSINQPIDIALTMRGTGELTFAGS